MAVDSGAIDSPLLLVSGGVVDYKNRPVDRSRCGGWKSASFIIGVEVAERFAYYGISTNLITFLTGPLAQSTATAAANVNAWYGTATLLPLLGAFLADSFLGRYPTIIISSLIYILGLGLLTISAVFTSSSCTPQIQIIFFFFSLYLVAVAQGGHKPCVQAFGADQFDADDPEECKAKGSFFNWWYCCVCGGTTVNLVVLTFIQDNLGWVLGFGIPCIAMAIALILYLLGTTTYRYTINDDDRSPFIRIGQVYVKAIKNWRIPSSELSIDEESLGNLPHHNFQQFKFLNKALLSPDGKKEQVSICSMNDVEEAKSVLRLFPIWASCLGYAIVFAQSPTFFTKQGVTLNRSVGSSFEIPPAALQSFISLSIVIIIPIYDRVLVPCARAVSGKPSGITMLQRIGVGIALSIISMVIAALVEMKRLQTARDYGIVDKPNVTIPMEIWWLVPQYVIFGIADVFTMVGLQEFFYDQVPSELKSIGLALYLSIFGVGSFLSSFLISIIEKTSGCNGQDSWFSDNLNRGHLDYFYWLLGGLSSMSGESQLDDMNVQLIDPNPVAGDQLHSSLLNPLPLPQLMSMLGTERHRFCCRYRTIFISSFIYILGLGLLTLSAAFSSSSSTGCINATNTAKFYPPRIQIIFFFFSLYLVAVAQGGHKPCVQAFGADQFDVDNPEECKAKSSFFNWWYFGLCSGTIVAVIVLSYIYRTTLAGYSDLEFLVLPWELL
ncbi:H+/oligopeptide symporter [Heracleum sosnowskyi]|uniref:H+/oligopeptide symporter n=1 Tax=Heracleum sosnowskyi TaxID=360622 RepID=A0AAD8MUF3_9APIA|nr:H+/oligopeptide symporter [Heracleum sosnowskyi]KAK1384303.1 H+/oligopeptide symporter [Heracleum sosnowskyi]